ncbi:glutamate-5-semialdehyde dehydrogenase [Marinoscillum pacificum]|uniref:glutamate-5-semialdehyde dehydrogenase n=1 Tax=Marinoscillum pacificum TaxID=392723 RepID=UPI002157CC30|nr:glutamate-5-semialdehyde dehydrogenase [Marinoscillum pacificum]
MEKQLIEQLEAIQSASRKLIAISGDQKKKILNEVADLALAKEIIILEANQKDLDRMDPTDPKYDRLLLNASRLQSIASDMRRVAELPNPLGKVLDEHVKENGLRIARISVPIGVIGVVYESRPNVTFDVFALTFKTGNACVLKGSRDAADSNEAIVSVIREVLSKYGLEDTVLLAPAEREALPVILTAEGLVDCIIPRGSQGLIDFVRKNASIPVIETGAGIVHTYVDVDADLAKAKAIVQNAKTRRVSVCNALDCLIIHKDRLTDLSAIVQGMDAEYAVEIHADQLSFEALQSSYDQKLLIAADVDDFGIEWLSHKMSIKVVNSLTEALDHIAQYSSKHSEAIVSENLETVELFLQQVDAACVYSNASTAFSDGGEFGLGAEIGISTQKLHARGPMGLREITSYKWVVRGDGQVRG